jgi:GTP-binding protein
MKPHTKMSKTSVDNFSLFRSEQAIEEADVVLLLLDPVLGPTMQDKRIAGKILDAHKACVILVQKWDIAQQEHQMTETKALPALRKMMPFLNFAPVVFCSNKSGYNIRRTIDAIDRAAASASERLPTGMLNRVLTAATKKTLSPMIKGKRLKVYYGLQVSTNPQTIRLFVNDPKLVTPQYLSFLEKNVRARFGLEGAPLRIFLKARPRNSKTGAKGPVIPFTDENAEG